MPSYAAPAPQVSERTGNNASSSGDVLDVLEASPVEDSAVSLAPLPAGGEQNEPLAGDPQDPAPEEVNRLKEKAVSTEHLLTHQPKNPYCEACQRGKLNAPHAVKNITALLRCRRPRSSESAARQITYSLPTRLARD